MSCQHTVWHFNWDKNCMQSGLWGADLIICSTMFSDFVEVEFSLFFSNGPLVIYYNQLGYSLPAQEEPSHLHHITHHHHHRRKYQTTCSISIPRPPHTHNLPTPYPIKSQIYSIGKTHLVILWEALCCCLGYQGWDSQSSALIVLY